MSKNKKSNVTNHIDNLNLEIDYDKLAQALSNVESKNKEEESTASREWMKFLLTPIFYSVSIFLIILSIGFIKLIFDFIKLGNGIWEDSNYIKLIVLFLGLLFIVSMAVFTFFAAKEIEKEKDRNYVASIFSNVVSFVALIISLIALFIEIK